MSSISTLFLLSCLIPLFFTQVIHDFSQIIHSDASLGKSALTKDGSNLIISQSTKNPETALISKLDKNSNFLYENKNLNLAYSSNALITESKTSNGEEGFTFYYKLNGKEYLTQFKDEGVDLSKKDFTSYNSIASLINLKNEKIFFAGIEPKNDDFVQKKLDLKIYDPQTQTIVIGKTLNAEGRHISCAELKDNEVYCAFVHEENILRSILKIQRFKISEDGTSIDEGTPFLIKSFYTPFNSLKVTKISNDKIGILFQTGNKKYNKKIPYGNTGKDLYFYELEVSAYEVKVIRFDYIYNNCRYKEDYEDYTIDIISSGDFIFAICENDNEGKDAKSLELIKIELEEKEFEPITLNKFNNAKAVKNPSFVKFDNLIGILYTRVDSSDKKDVMLLTINFPYCEDSTKEFTMYEICPNKKQKNVLSSHFNIYLINPYPSSMSSSPLFYRLISTDGMTISDSIAPLELNKDYSSSTISSLFIKDFGEGKSGVIEYMVTRKEGEEIVKGKTCKINIKSPECKEQCDGCDEYGIDEDHRCFRCKNGTYPVEKHEDKTGCGEKGKIYNCNKCDIACTECLGPFDQKKPTTNCQPSKCNYTLNYFPFYKDETICINEANKTFWEENLGCVLFLDKYTVSNDKYQWKYKCCHQNCGSCRAEGTDEDQKCDTCKKTDTLQLFFYCNQTKGKGIPGNCHETCEGEGCYKSDPQDTEGMEKMCPCLPQCKECKNNITCEKCWPKWLLQPEKTSCKKTCDYCLTPHFDNDVDKTNGKCINCKELNPPQYTFENKCYEESKIPEFTYKEYTSEYDYYNITKKYHVIDEKCNLLTGCKSGCFKCAQLESANCTECEEDYYIMDYYNKSRPSYFKCLSKRQCQGNDTYPHVPGEQHGGVPVIENGEKICLNCKQRNDSYRQPEENYYCGPKSGGTYVDIPDYNKLSKCYVRCKTCEKFGNQCSMACTSCKDSAYYDLVKYNKFEGQCYRKQHKCGIYPYWHNYELAIDEDNCGEDCDVCLYNFQCPKEFPFLKPESHECVEFCPFTDIMGGQCNVNTTNALFILLRNPFGLRNPYDFINKTVTIHQIIESNLFQYFCSAYHECPQIKEGITNFLGSGQIFNLPESKIIVGNNISIEISSVKLELQKIIDYLAGNSPKLVKPIVMPNIIPTTNGTTLEPENEPENEPEEEVPLSSGVNLTECSSLLKKKYNLPEEEDLMIIKADTLKKYNLSIENLNEFFGTDVDFQIFSVSLGAFLPLDICLENKYEVTNPFTGVDVLLKEFKSKTASVVSNGYDAFDAYSPFYNDICTPFTNENGNDVLLDSRRKDYYNENVNLCGNSCIFLSYNTKSMTYNCRCNMKSYPGEETGEYDGEIVEREIPENFKDLISKRSNIAVFKCAKNVFSAKGQKNNWGSYLIMACFAAFVGVVVFHFVKEREKMKEIYNNIGKIANPPKGDKKGEKEDKKEEKKEGKKKKIKKSKIENKEKEQYGEFIKPEGKKAYNIGKDITDEDYEINFASYDEVKSKDFRSYLQTYWSFIKFKQLIIFTFFTSSRGILRSTKIALFILFIAFYMAFTALFFNDSIMRAIYIYKGNTNAAVHVPNIILSSLCSFIATLIVRFLCLNEREVFNIAREKDDEKRKDAKQLAERKAKIKLYIFFAIAGLILLLCWYYVSAFCAIFKNSQKNYLINFVVCFIVVNLWPFVTSIIPTIMRRKALNDCSSKTLYEVSRYVAIL